MSSVSPIQAGPISELRDAAGQGITQALQSPIGFGILAVILSVFLISGAVTTTRWVDSRLVMLIRAGTRRPSASSWSDGSWNPPPRAPTPSPSAPVQYWRGQQVDLGPSAGHPARRRSGGAPLRSEPGPRDW